MCGIAGILNFDSSAASLNQLKSMTNSIAHRGPDGDGFYISGPVGLGHRRLAIIDLTPSGKQPMPNEDGSIWVTFNGEIYNYQELRRQLESCGHIFSSSTDTEVLIHGYEEWGMSCLERLNGMFAFALWDERKSCLWLARDRLGVKPLFYANLPDGFLFGSEIKAILSDSRVDRELDYEALAYYLALNYVPAPHTLFKRVRQVLPGHYLLLDIAGQIQDVEYWDLVYQEDQYPTRDNALEQFSDLLEDSVRLRLVSDVPFGVFLSGGLDSSSVAYWMARNMAEPVKTFTIGFGESTYDELDYARQVVQTIHAEHHEQLVQANAAEILPRIVWHSEEPTSDSSMVAVYYLAKQTRQFVSMVLSGDGADEILAGYETYQAFHLLQVYQRLPYGLRQLIANAFIHWMPVRDDKVSWDTKLRRFIAGANLPGEDAHAMWRIIFDTQTRLKLLAPVLHQPGVQADILDLYRSVFARTNAHHPLNRMLYVDTRFYLPNDMLVKVDRMTMAHGLEAREPFLDYRLVEFAAGISPGLKLKNFTQKKYLLKAAMKDKLPNDIVWRKKAGFNVPNARWLKQDLKPWVRDLLSPQRIRSMGLLDDKVVQNLLKDHFDGRAENSHQIWCLLNLVLWWDQFVSGRISL